MTVKTKFAKLKRFSNLKDLSMVRSLVLIFSFLLQSMFAYAGSVESILELQDEYQSVYQGVVLPPLEQLFDDEYSLSRYYEEVRQGKCNMAMLDLGTAFHKKNPNLPNPHGHDDRGGLLAWHNIVMPRFYPELVFCRAMQSLEKYDRQVKERAFSDKFRFSQFEKPLNPKILPGSPLGRRASSAGDLFRLTLFDYAPAHVALAALSEKGDAVRLTPAYNYYLLVRAKQLGYAASDLAALLKKATAALTPEERQALAPRIKSGDWPRAERRVLD